VFAMPELIAYHEAGHALMALLLGGTVQQVTIEPDNDDGPQRQGDTQVRWRRSRMSDKDFAVIAVQVCLAGPVAEMIYSGDPYHPGLVAEWAADWRDAWNIASALHVDSRARLQYLESVSVRLYHRMKQDDHWSALASLADHLLVHETLDAEQVEEIVGEWLHR
jgi:ATP-dependent Zn protease